MRTSRRRFLEFSLNGLVAVGGSSLLNFSFLPQNTSWDLSALNRLEPGQNLDLNLTLPKHLKRGGQFSVDQSGSPLPNGVSLSHDGHLSVGIGVSCAISGIIFSYEEPA